MKKLLLGLIFLISGCTMGSNGSHEEYKSAFEGAPDNCQVSESAIYLINGLPALKYICQK